MRVIFHVGPHKTGTTAIQLSLDRYRSELSSKGVHIPKPLTGFPGQHEISWSMLGWNLRTVGAPQARYSVTRILAKEIRRAHAQRCSTIVFSSEDFSLLEPREWRETSSRDVAWRAHSTASQYLDRLFKKERCLNLYPARIPQLCATESSKVFTIARNLLSNTSVGCIQSINSASGAHGEPNWFH